MTEGVLLIDGTEHPVTCKLAWTNGGRHATGSVMGSQAALSAAFEQQPVVLRLRGGRELKIALNAHGLDWAFRSVDH